MFSTRRSIKIETAPDLKPAPEVGQAINVDGYEGIITRVGFDHDAPSPIYGDPHLSVQVVGVTGEWSYWLHVDDLAYGRGGWRYTSPVR